MRGRVRLVRSTEGSRASVPSLRLKLILAAVLGTLVLGNLVLHLIVHDKWVILGTFLAAAAIIAMTVAVRRAYRRDA